MTFRPVFWLTTLLVLLGGCATLSHPMAGTVHEERKRRDAEVLGRMDRQRDFAEFEAALARWNQQDVPGTHEALGQLLSRNPQHRDARLLMADVLLAENQPRAALDQVKQALAAHPNDADALYAMGLLLETTGQRAAALPHYEQAMKLAPSNEVYAMGYRSAREAVARGSTAAHDTAGAKGAGNDRRATAAGFDAPADGADRAKDAVTRQLEKGYAALANGSASAALSEFQKAAALKPDNPQIPISAATAALRHNQPQVAVDLLAPAVKRFSQSAAMYRILGAAHYRLEDYAASQLALQQALSLDKSNALSYFLMGCTLAKLGQPEPAEAHFQEAQALDPRYAVRR